MVRSTITFITIVCIFSACKKDSGVAPQGGSIDDAAFNRYEKHFLDAFWKLEPDWASRVGFHQYDSLLMVPGKAYREKLLAFAKVQLDSLGRYNPSQLLPANRIDFAILQNQMEYLQWQVEQLKAYHWDPTAYVVTETFAGILNQHYAALPKRLNSFYQKMLLLPAYYKEAERQIKDPSPDLTNLAVERLTGSMAVFETEFRDSLQKAAISEPVKKLMLERARQAAIAIRGFSEFLKTLKNDHPRSFRLGKDLYESKFKYLLQASENAQQLYNAAIERKKKLHAEMARLGRKLWPKYFKGKAMPADTLDMIAAVIDTLSAKHATAGQLQQSIQQELPRLSTFVQSKDLVAPDPARPLFVRTTPAFMAGAPDAFLSSPGPYDPSQNAYFYIAGTNGWPPEKVESFLREYNAYTLPFLCIHEGIPGHFVQLAIANREQGMIRAVFPNEAMVEGWAVYAEELMMDAGFGDNTDEQWLMWDKWHLRSVCNTLVDYGVHCLNLPRQQALTLLTREAFQQPAEAENKWKRVSVSSVKLDSYFEGYLEIMELRKKWKEKMGAQFKLKEFNEKLLSFGSAPVRLIRDVMLAKEPAGP